jgi:sigma-B regulation protein RsbU (phosphoserine phosphatase)
MILGILPRSTYEQQVTRIQPGDTLVLYSDGVTEAARPADSEEYGEERLATFVLDRPGLGASDLIDAILADVGAWSAGSPPADDVTLVAARLLSR